MPQPVCVLERGVSLQKTPGRSFFLLPEEGGTTKIMGSSYVVHDDNLPGSQHLLRDQDGTKSFNSSAAS